MPIFKFEAFYRFTMIGPSSGSYSAFPPSTALLLWLARGGWIACCLSHWAPSFRSIWVFSLTWLNRLCISDLQRRSSIHLYLSHSRITLSGFRFASAMSHILSLKQTSASKCAGDLYLLWPYCVWRVFKMLCKSSVTPLTWKQTHQLNLVFCIADFLHDLHILQFRHTIERD